MLVIVVYWYSQLTYLFFLPSPSCIFYFATDGFSVTLVLTELERVRAIERGATTGGDGSSLNLTLLAAAVHDIGTNPSNPTSNLGVIIQEVDDTTPPRVVSATVDLGTKVMIISSNEWIDSTPSSLVDLSNTHVSNWVMEDNAPLQVERDPYSVGFGSANITLAGADVVAFDGYNVTIHLTELMRTGLLFLSGHPWDNIDGVAIDGNAYTEGELVIPPGALMDIGQNRQTENAVIKLIEFPDQVKPVLIRAVVDYNDGKLELYPSETLHNVMANIDLSYFRR